MPRISIVILFFSVIGIPLQANAIWPSGNEAIPLVAQPFDLHDVRLLDGPFRDAMQRTQQYLHELEADRLLHFFYVTANLPSSAEPMGGWETTEVRGHTMGHYLSACAAVIAGCDDHELKEKADRIVAELARCQAAHGNGYLSAFPESFIDRVIARQPVWAPWYTLHKLFAGLMDMYIYTGNRQALQIAQGMAGWAKSRLDPLDRNAMQAMLDTTEQGGMNEALANLYGLTGERDWLALSLRFVQDSYVEPLARHEDRLKGQHVNSFIPNMIGTARQYELTGDLAQRDSTEFFWNEVVSARSYCTGGTSIDEHWKSDPYHLADQLGDHTQETCCTYNMLKLTRHLFAWHPLAKYADYYERTLLNSILATQDPATGMMMYFVPLESGYWKYFNTPRDSFWCCTGTGLENHVKYADSIYFHDDKGIWVNLFIASELGWKQKGVRIRQETQFPEKENTTLIVQTKKPVSFALRIRVPEWAHRGIKLTVNRKPVLFKIDTSGYVIVDRLWKNRDKVEVTFPMDVWVWPMPDDDSIVAFLYGPTILAGDLGGEGLTPDVTYVTDNWYKFSPERVAQAPVLTLDPDDTSHWIQRVSKKELRFQIKQTATGEPVTLIPYHQLWNRRYAVYWRLKR